MKFMQFVVNGPKNQTIIVAEALSIFMTFVLLISTVTDGSGTQEDVKQKP